MLVWCSNSPQTGLKVLGFFICIFIWPVSSLFGLFHLYLSIFLFLKLSNFMSLKHDCTETTCFSQGCYHLRTNLLFFCCACLRCFFSRVLWYNFLNFFNVRMSMVWMPHALLAIISGHYLLHFTSELMLQFINM